MMRPESKRAPLLRTSSSFEPLCPECRLQVEVSPRLALAVLARNRNQTR